MGALVLSFVLSLGFSGCRSTNDTSNEMESPTTPGETFHERLCKSREAAMNRSSVEFIFFTDINITTRATCYDSTINDSLLQICFNQSTGLECRARIYPGKEFFRVVNSSAPVNGESVESLYDYHEGGMLLCTGNCDSELITNAVDVGEYTNKYRLWTRTIGSYINALCVAAYLVIFCLVPALRNSAGYNVASMTVAYFVSYVLKLIDMTPAFQPDLRNFCWTSAVLKYYFGLVTFFSMNAMSFIIWRTLKRSTEKFVVAGTRKGLKQFFWYFVYSWGTSLLPVVAAIVVDGRPGIPPQMRPQFGRNNDCWFTTNGSKQIFLSIPVLCLMICNAVFFVLCALIIKRGSMKRKKGDSKQSAPGIRVSVYLRLGVMLGATWLLGSIFAVIANVTNKLIFWLILDIIMTFHGVVLLLVFACNKHVYRYFRCTGSQTPQGYRDSSTNSAPSTKKTSMDATV